jgi:hypothetical protein
MSESYLKGTPVIKFTEAFNAFIIVKLGDFQILQNKNLKTREFWFWCMPIYDCN